MSSQFSDETLLKKLGELNQSQNTIQSLSSWLIFHRKHAKAVAKVWYKEYRKAAAAMKLTFIYLANDVIQNSRKKGSEYSKVFAAVLPAAYKEASRVGDGKTHDCLKRLINIWKERQVYEEPFLEQLTSILSKRKPKREKEEKSRKTTSHGPPGVPAVDKARPASATKRSHDTQDGEAGETVIHESPMKKIKTGDILSLRDELDAQLAKDRCDPPELEDVIMELTTLLKSPSADSVTRHRIANFPPEVGDYSALNNIKSKRDCEALLSQTSEADEVLVKYNESLQEELADRKRVAVLLRTFILYQNDKIKDSEIRLKDYKDKLDKANTVRGELSSHLSKLPDLTMLPDSAGGLKPLPSVDVLFN